MIQKPKLLPTPDFSSMLFSTKFENQKVFSHILLKLLNNSQVYSNCFRLPQLKPDLHRQARKCFPKHTHQDKDAQQHHTDKLGPAWVGMGLLCEEKSCRNSSDWSGTSRTLLSTSGHGSYQRGGWRAGWRKKERKKGGQQERKKGGKEEKCFSEELGRCGSKTTWGAGQGEVTTAAVGTHRPGTKLKMQITNQQSS